jgi:hypothetical protein
VGVAFQMTLMRVRATFAAALGHYTLARCCGLAGTWSARAWQVRCVSQVSLGHTTNGLGESKGNFWLRRVANRRATVHSLHM